ncbi:MAG: hypothetical protein KDG55_11005 [Rhodocyclaceae bacterium]|nr:hypothetical protein [Rhodocyclaceae bacterium]
MNTGLSSALSIPTFIDVEASGLGRGSYPIEIGISLPDGWRCCWLIRPADTWTHWDPAAEAIHHISRDRLRQHGRPIDEVAAELNERLKGAMAYSDAWGNDMPWIARLYDEAGLPQRFRIESVRRILSEAQAARWHGAKALVMRETGGERHRASGDAMILQQTWLEVAGLRARPRSDGAA